MDKIVAASQPSPAFASPTHSRDDILSLARETRDGLLGGAITPEQLTPKGQRLLQIGRGEVDLDRLSPQDRALIGLEPTLMQRVGEVLPSPAFAPAAKPLGLVTEGVPAAVRAAGQVMMEPLAGARMLHRAVAPPEPVLGGPPIDPSLLERAGFALDPAAWGLGVGEALMRIPSAFGAAIGEIGPEKAKALTHTLAANLPFIAPLLRAKVLPVAGGVTERPAPPPVAPAKPPLALPPGETFTIVPPAARTRSMLEAGRPPRELPAAAPDAADFVVLGGERPVVAEPPAPLPEVLRALPPGVVPKAVTGRVVSQTKALPGPRLTEPQRGRALPGAVPLSETGEGGGLVVGRGLPEPPPEALPAKPAPAPPPLPPVSDLKPPPPTGTKVVPPAAKPSRAGKGPEERVVVDELAEHVRDALMMMREELKDATAGSRARHVSTQAGKGKVERWVSTPSTFPEWMGPVRNRPLADRMMREIDTVLDGKPAGRNERWLITQASGLAESRYKLPVSEKMWKPGSPISAAAPGAAPPVPVAVGADVVPPDLARRISQAEWDTMSATERTNTAEAFRWFDEVDRAEGKGGLSGILPPVPLPGAEEGDDADTATIKTAAQALGLSLPLVSMLFSRWRGGPRRPKQQGLGFEGAGPQKGLFDRPLPEVPPAPSVSGRIGPYRNATDDELLRLTASGGKPAAVLPNIADALLEGVPWKPSPEWQQALQKVQASGLPYTVEGSNILVGRDRQSLETLRQAWLMRGPLGDAAVGRALGYTEADIAAFPEVPPPPTARTAPVRWAFWQDVRGKPSLEQWHLTEDIPGHPKGSTLSRQTLEAEGYAVPRAPTPPGFERTPLGDQGVIPGTPPREIPPTPLRAEGPQAEIAETPLFGQERAAREAAGAGAQGALNLPPVGEPPAGVRWQPVPPRQGTLDAYRSADGRFLVEQRTPDEWVAVDRQTRAEATFPTFHEARRWAAEGGVSRSGERGAFLPGARLFGKEEPPPPVPGRPPQVPGQYRTERAGRQPLPEGEAQPAADVAQGVRQAVEDIRSRLRGEGDLPPISEEGLPPGGTTAPPPRTLMPSDVPEDPAPQWSRFARFMASVKTTRPLRNMNAPEDVVASDPVATRVVRTTYRAGENQLALRRELEDAFEQTFAGLPETSVEEIGRALDTAIPGRVQYGPEAMAQEAAALRRMLAPDLAARAVQARDLIVRYTDATGLPQANRFASYFPHFRDRVRVNETTLVLDPEGQPYLSQSYEVPKRLEAFFHKPRTTADPPSHLGRDAFRVFARATARHLTLNGGDHPFTGERLNGYLNDIAPRLSAVMPELRPYTADFVNHFLGTPGSRAGSPGGHQLSRIARNLQGARLLSGPGSMIVNATQQGNTLALVRPSSWVRGYADLLDPERRALAQRWIGLEELGKADLERVQQISSGLDKVEDMSGKLAQVTMTGFRKVETGNRYHAFLAGLRDAEAFGLEGRTAIEYARDISEQAQFPTMAAARPEIARSDWGAALWQMKQFQTRQALFVKNLIRDDVKDLMRAAKGEPVPIEIGGKPVLRPDGTPYTRDAVSVRNLPMHRTAKFIAITTLVGGPDALFPGLDEYLREQDIKIPGLLPALGAGVASLSAYGFISPGDLTRSVLFFLPGPLIGNVQDALSATTGKNFGHGLNEFLAMTDLSLDQQVEAGVRAVPGLGVFGAKLLRGARGVQTPGEERASLTPREAFAMEPSRGPLLRRAEALDPVRLGLGLQPAEKEEIRGERRELADLDARAKQAVQVAADDYAAGERARGDARLRDAEQRLNLPPGSLEVSAQAEKAAEQRRGFTPLERRQFEMRRRFPDIVERSRRRLPGEEPEEPRERHGLGIPRLKLR